MKILKKYLSTLLIILMLALPASYAFTATGLPFHRVSGGINTSAFVANSIMTIDKGYLNQIREGNIPNHTYVRIQGNNLAVSTALEEISDLGTVGYGNWPAAAAGAILVSDDVADDSAGTGARTVIVRGLDSSYVAASETVTMDGTTPATITTQTFIRIHELEVVTAGTGLANAGTITASISGTDIIALLPGHSKSKSGRYTVPAGNTLYLENPEISVIGTKQCAAHVFTRNTQVANSPFVLQRVWQAQDGGYLANGKLEGIPEKYDVILLGEAGAASTIAAASLEGWIET
jgi:hypothetical protein